MLVARVSEAEVILNRVALEKTEQVRPDSTWSFQSVATHFASRRHRRGRNYVRRNSNLGEGDPANVRSDADGRDISVRLCQTWTFG